MTNPIEQQIKSTPLESMSKEQAIKYLSGLTKLEYEIQRDEAAKIISVRSKVLDELVIKARKDIPKTNDSNSFFSIITPAPNPVNGEILLNRIEAACKEYVICEQSTRTAVCLWIALTWLIDHVDCLPIANITAPEKNCGKSTLLSFIGNLAFHPLTTSNITSSALFCAIENGSQHYSLMKQIALQTMTKPLGG